MGTPQHPTPHRPLPLRDGVDPVCFRLPQHLPATWENLSAADILLERFDRSQQFLAEQLAAGLIVDDEGRTITADTPAQGGMALWSYRPLPASEPEVPLEMPVLYRDEDLLVIDKPHFLPTIPRGRYVVHTALVQLRRQLAAEIRPPMQQGDSVGCQSGDGVGRQSGDGATDPYHSTSPAGLITPAHRLDRLTAGVLLFTLRKELRGPIQTLFTHGRTQKVYFAVAPLPGQASPLRDPARPLLDGHPVDVRSRIMVSRNRLDCYEEPGEPNAHTTVELVQQRGEYGLYRLTPHTGKTHQLRVHMNSLGTNLVGDPLYPVVLDDGPDHPEDPQRTLQLLSAQLILPDPHPRVFRSERTLQWPDGTPAPHRAYLDP